jgi:hypothetical protein
LEVADIPEGSKAETAAGLLRFAPDRTSSGTTVDSKIAASGRLMAPQEPDLPKTSKLICLCPITRPGHF